MKMGLFKRRVGLLMFCLGLTLLLLVGTACNPAQPGELGGSSGVNIFSLRVLADPSKSTSLGQPIFLEGFASGGVGGITVQWSPADNLDDATTLQPLFTPTLAGQFVYSLTVTDSEGTTANDSVIVTVES